MSDYYQLARGELSRILAGVPGLAAVHPDDRPAEQCRALPAVAFTLVESLGRRHRLSSMCEVRELNFKLSLYAACDAERTAAENLEALEAAVRAAFENDNVAGTSRANTGGVVLFWRGLDTKRFTVDRHNRLGACVSSLRCDIRRPYGS